MEKKLSELCLSTLSDEIVSSPPMIREMIGDAVLEKLREDIEEQVRKDTCQDIMKVVSTMIVQLKDGDALWLRNAQMKYPSVDVGILDAASEIAMSTYRLSRKRRRSYY